MPLFVSNYLFPRIFPSFLSYRLPLSHFNLTSPPLVFIILSSCLRPRLYLLPWLCLAYSTTASPVLTRLTMHLILGNIILHHIQSIPTSPCVHLVLACLLFSSPVSASCTDTQSLSHVCSHQQPRKRISPRLPPPPMTPFHSRARKQGWSFTTHTLRRRYSKTTRSVKRNVTCTSFAYTRARQLPSASSHLSLRPYHFLFPSLPFLLH